MLESNYLLLLVRLGLMAAIASVLARSNTFKAILMRETRTMNQRLELSLWLSIVFGSSVAARVLISLSEEKERYRGYQAGDLGLEGSLIAGLLGGYVTGLLSGVLISLPAVFIAHERVTMPLLAGIGVLGGLLRDWAPDPEEIWRFTPFFDLNIYRFFKESHNHRRTAFHLLFFAAILVAEFLRQTVGGFS